MGNNVIIKIDRPEHVYLVLKKIEETVKDAMWLSGHKLTEYIPPTEVVKEIIVRSGDVEWNSEYSMNHTTTSTGFLKENTMNHEQPKKQKTVKDINGKEWPVVLVWNFEGDVKRERILLCDANKYCICVNEGLDDESVFHFLNYEEYSFISWFNFEPVYEQDPPKYRACENADEMFQVLKECGFEVCFEKTNLRVNLCADNIFVGCSILSYSFDEAFKNFTRPNGEPLGVEVK